MNKVPANMIDRILIVGLGSIGKRHLRIARELVPNADIRILRHRVTSEVPQYSDGCFSSIEEAVAFTPQIAIIANPASFHVPIAQPLAEIGVHLLIEKPLSDSLDGVAQLIETCRNQDAVLLTGYNLRFLPSIQRFRDLLEGCIVGKILSVRCEIGQYLPSWRPGSDYRDGVSARQELGGGVLLELSHEIDYLRWIFGEVTWVKASLSRQSNLEISVEDSAHLVVGFAPSVDNYQLIGMVNLDFIRHDTTRECVAIGERGSLRWNGLTGEVSVYEAGAKGWRMLFNPPQLHDESYIAEWQNLLACVTEGKKPLISGVDGLKVLQIIEAVRKSAISGGQISKVDTGCIKRVDL